MENKDTFDDVLVDTIFNQIMGDFAEQLKAKITELIKDQDSKGLKQLVKSLSKMGC